MDYLMGQSGQGDFHLGIVDDPEDGKLITEIFEETTEEEIMGDIVGFPGDIDDELLDDSGMFIGIAI